MRITKKKVIVGTLVAGALIAALPAVAEAKGGRGGGSGAGAGIATAALIEAGDKGPANSAPPGYFLVHVKLKQRPGALVRHKYSLDFKGFDANGTQIVDVQVNRKHSENFYTNPFKVSKIQLLFEGKPAVFSYDQQGNPQTMVDAQEDYCFALQKGQLAEVRTGFGCNAL
jgi:hypothetical protein